MLDGDVVSELMKPAPDETVAGWLAAQPATSLYTTSITQAEVLHALQLLPARKRRAAFAAASMEMFEQDFAGRILPFGSEAAPSCGRIAATRRRAGRPISQFGAQFAAIASVAGATIATRNVGDFAECGVEVVSPWRRWEPGTPDETRGRPGRVTRSGAAPVVTRGS